MDVVGGVVHGQAVTNMLLQNGTFIEKMGSLQNG